MLLEGYKSPKKIWIDGQRTDRKVVASVLMSDRRVMIMIMSTGIKQAMYTKQGFKFYIFKGFMVWL